MPPIFALAMALACPLAADTDPISQLETGNKPLSPSTQPARATLEQAIDRGLTFLTDWQQPNGAWDRLENNYFDPPKDQAEVKETEHLADTCLSAQAMLLASTSRKPELSANFKHALDFVCKQIDRWNDGKTDTIYIQKRVFDPLHDKTPTLGDIRYFDPTVDTFFALDFLVQARERVEDPDAQKKITRALQILLTKIEKCQQLTGTWLDDTDPALGLTTRVQLPSRQALGGAGIGGAVPGWMIEIADYSTDRKNLVTHAFALKSLCNAARHDLPVNPQTLALATLYFRNSFRAIRWNTGDEPHYAISRQHSPNPILLTVWIGTLYECDATARHLLAQAQTRQQRGEKVADLALLQTRAGETRAELLHALDLLKQNRTIGVIGPAAACLPEFLQALRDFRPQDAAIVEQLVQQYLLPTQASDGRFKSPGLRGDNTYSTAATLRTLIQMAR